MKLTNDQLNFFYKNGYVVLPSVLNPQQVEDLRKKADDLVDSDIPFFREVKQHSVDLRHLIELEQGFSSLVCQEQTLAAVLQIMGYSIHLASSHLSFIHSRETTDGWKSNWHTDIYGAEDDLGDQLVRMGLKCAFPLTDHITDDSGMTLILPGSHRSGLLPEIKKGEMHPEGAMQPKVMAGDCMIFENRLRHSVGINTSGNTRKCIFMGYTYRWVLPLDELSDTEGLREEIDSLSADLLPRGYRVADSGALREFCVRHDIPLRPAIKN